MRQAVSGLLTELHRDTEPPSPLGDRGYAAASLWRLGARHADTCYGGGPDLTEALAEVKGCRNAVFGLIDEQLSDRETATRARRYVQGFFDCTEIALARRWVSLSLGEAAVRCAEAAEALSPSTTELHHRARP